MKHFTILFSLVFGLSFAASAQIADGSFEAGAAAGTWTEASTNFGTPLCDLATCGDCGGPCAPNTGTFYAWFGGANAVETGSVEQSAVIPTGSVVALNMMVYIAGAGDGLAADRLEVSVDGNVVNTVTAQDSVMYGAGYTQLVTDVTAMADGNAHTIRIEGFQTTATVFNVLVDDVDLVVDGLSTDLFEEVMGEEGIFVYPNPANEIVNLEFRNIDGDATVTISNMNGAVVSQEQINEVSSRTFNFNTVDLDAGVYFIQVENNGETTTKRFVVAH